MESLEGAEVVYGVPDACVHRLSSTPLQRVWLASSPGLSSDMHTAVHGDLPTDLEYVDP